MLPSHRLRKTLIELVLVATPLAGCFNDNGSRVDAGYPYDPCYDYQKLTKVEPEPPSAALFDLVRKCEADKTQCDALCRRVLQDEGFGGYSVQDCTVTHSFAKHTITVGYCPVIVEGRRPAGLVGARKRCIDVASGHLARAAFYEAASVHAFVQLARELRRHRAPRALVTAARRSAAEEIYHAQAMAELARSRGATPPPVVVAPPRRRSIESIAIENAREGLVGETWSAMIAVWQSLHAPDPAVRAIYARIADDELRHAELAVAVDEWAQSRLAPAARRRVEAARSSAVAQLSRQARRAPHPALVGELGVPDRAASTRLFSEARANVWS